MIPDCPEWLRKTLGITAIVTMVVGSAPLHLGAPVHLIILLMSATATSFFLGITFRREIGLIIGVGIIFGLAIMVIFLVPTFLWMVAFEADGLSYEWHAAGLMGLLTWFGLVYLIMKDLIKKAK